MVGVSEIKLADQDPLVRERKAEGHNNVDNLQQAKSIYHCRVLQDICYVVDRHIFLCDSV